MTTSIVFVALTLGLTVWAIHRARRHEVSSAEVLAAAIAEGMTEPPSLHPVIDDDRCIGCAACVDACPEKQILGLVDGKARLIGASHCVGHGACQGACPTEAIELVFGTETRGVDIPFVSPQFETNVPGIFIAGELGGMGLIRNAFEQGRQAIDAIARLDGIGNGADHDVVIVGAGPAGFAATLSAQEKGLRTVTLEQDTLGGTIAHYPRGKLVMTRPGKLALVGRVHFTETTKEKLLDFFRRAELDHAPPIRYRERVDSIERTAGGFQVITPKGRYATRAVLLAIGRRGTPRKLGVPGEQLDKVVYRLIDPERYRGGRVLVVGGGDSALEAATSLAVVPGTTVALCYRSAAFNRAKQANRERLDEAQRDGRLRVLLRAEVEEIHAGRVDLRQDGKRVGLDNDHVIVCAGGILPTPFLRGIGVEIETRYGTS